MRPQTIADVASRWAAAEEAPLEIVGGGTSAAIGAAAPGGP